MQDNNTMINTVFTIYQMKVIQLCSDYAAIAHNGQFRKDKKTPYITHPARVANLFENQYSYRYQYVAAAWLHDVMEDCSLIMGLPVKPKCFNFRI